ncbi:MAG TPA: UDP-N-acetylglucosamine--N-acetylmuramyl-(pentapeptide) pyrophosphoryl-undecaprenol N-acetylglucosamine transferase [Pirellulales bacterium]|jgi:UDP-N-acetylglucosamine--N-acetylmuramyl-(pentapeptide) pyrophosphoryl-undecaprenol N-acetylglucosamine transferase|nr:UDP-N-acetylglucosamine--N-acetylmuramyl-(pentapeptide) pyrophosphoryl-undecaprenol N-acetylglucosamine transferase [Pirellulales bacterium]
MQPIGSPPLQHVIFSGGGTGGHLFPGLAVAARLARSPPETQITFVGSGRELERRLVAEAGYRYLAIDCRPFSWRPARLLPFMTAHLRGGWRARALLAQEQADVVVGLGGFASVPLARAAVRQGVPLVLLEQNAIPGRANRWLTPHASLICLALAEARAGLPRTNGRVLTTGNPLREGFDFQTRNKSVDPCASRLLVVLGGSGGSRQLNQAVPEILALAGGHLAGWRVLHQAGLADAAAVSKRYRERGLPADAVDFIADVPGTLGSADLVISRGGGTTLSELAAAGVPAIICPLGHAAHDHQRRNAEVYARRGACRVWQPQWLDAVEMRKSLARELIPLLGDCQRRAELGRAMRSLAYPLAAHHVADEIRALCTPQRSEPLADSSSRRLWN